MKKPTNDQVRELVEQIVLPFYQIERDMTFAVGSGYRNENDAEHSWSVALIACALASHIDPTLDVGLVSQFAIVHDLVEVYSSDVSVWADDNTLANKEKNEHAAFEKIKKNYAHFPWMVKIVEKYEKQDTDEALYVRSIDKYVALVIRFFEDGRFYKEQGITKAKFDKVIETPRRKAHLHEGAAAYFEAMKREFDNHPEQFSDVEKQIFS